MILIIDDDSAIRASLSLMLKRSHHQTITAASPKEAMEIVRERDLRLIMMDMNFSYATSGDEGLTLLKQVKLFRPHVPVILMTAWGSIDLAVKGMQAGAFDFITKPWNNVVLMQRIETALEMSAMTAGKEKENAEEDFDRSFIIGESRGLMEAIETARRISKTNAAVLITGESGTGKELIAELIHRNSRRKDSPFVKVNLGGVSQSLFESEMFGHKKGAFTDAVNDRKGRFEMADGGTIFLDEIGELDLSCQVKLLRVLQEQQFEPLGDSRTRQVDIRIVSATNADLAQMVNDKSFREDLFYRINLITIHLPPLRERREDIPLLVRHFAADAAKRNGIAPAEFPEETMQRFAALPYPGNIRELKNLVERVVLVGESVLDDITLTSLPEQSTGLHDMERQAVETALRKCEGNISQAAELLGISRPALYRRMEKYGISK
ncbi:sigma-54-dependent Fis family transcriptional regulator [Prevotella sp. PINT]|jgi:Response regulator containing CheY-like receiver, AAA-type ATPase, and DNA-binding domains|uniref:sigma-54-dependent transcriptional regulator n=1 Tax=Palleniella intestinalis TaxID=2736291 RepID=UPI00155359E2|nr:sigma-54 dependent transcriptional regulator [Palleniella intestinalis]NPD82057.1 sigma-54-dependent Fis family transcriptional regulator [Palleniella intestinalis]